MKKTICIILLICFTCLISMVGFSAYAEEPLYQIEESFANNVRTINITRGNKMIRTMSTSQEKLRYRLETLQLFDNNILDNDDLLQSENIVIQEEYFVFNEDEVPQTISYDNAIALLSDDDYVSSNWASTDGILAIATVAYKIGELSNLYSVFAVSGHAQVLKTYNNLNRNQDQLVLVHSSPALYFNNSGTQFPSSYPSALQTYYANIHNYNWNTGYYDFDGLVFNELSPNFEIGSAGVNFKFEFPEDAYRRWTGAYAFTTNKKYSQFNVMGTYYITIPKNSMANAQVYYVHNTNILATDLSISSGGVGIGLSIIGSCIQYVAQPILISNI